jgi:hypothetical protein
VETYADAQAYCEDLDYAGRTDWRLPTRLEMVTILDMKGGTGSSHFHPAFGDWPGNTFWWTSTAVAGTSSHYAISGNWPWFSYLSDEGSESYDMLARCVSENQGPLPQFSQIAVSANRVRDKRTRLEWEIADQAPRSWTDALTYCENLSTDGFEDWRLPTFKDLGTLIDDTRIDNAMAPVFSVNYDELWSSTALRADSGGENHNEIGFIRQSNGTTAQAGFTTSRAVRCVRGG